MGILDGALSGVLQQVIGNGDKGPMVGAALQAIQAQGGLPGLVTKLKDAGLGAQVESWVGTGANAAIQGGDLAKALGPETLGALAKTMGLPEGQLTDGLAKVLPDLVNQLTPNGTIPTNHGDLLTQAVGAFLKK